MTGRQRKAIVVLGMHRSGTSAVARLLALAGATPPRELMPATDDNPLGYWESRRIAVFNNRLLESAGTRWNDDGAIPGDWFTAAARQADLAEATAILAEEFAPSSCLVLKDPRICRLLPFWCDAFASAGIEPYGLIVARDPIEVACSLAARAGVPEFRPAAVPALSRGLLLLLRYVLDGERHSRGIPRQFVRYADLITDWRHALAPFFASGPLAAPDPEAASQIDGFLDPALRRQRSTSALATDIPQEAIALLRSLQADLHNEAGSALALRDQIATAFDGLQEDHADARRGQDPLAEHDPWSDRILAELSGQAWSGQTAPQPRSVLFLSAAPGSVGHVYRVEHVAAALTAAGWPTVILPLDDPTAVERVGSADIVVAFRARWSEQLAAVRDQCTAHGVPLVFDVDDLLFDPQVTAAGCIAHLDGLSSAERERWIADAADHRRALEAADAAILTTRALAQDAARVCNTTHILPNALDRRMESTAAATLTCPRPSAGDGRPRLMFASGTRTHHRDFAVGAEAVARVMTRRAEPILVILGDLDTTIYPALAPFADRIERRPRVPLADLGGELARCDINLCPLELGNPFCEAKSAVRWLAAATVGVPSIVSPTEALRDAVIDGVTGLVAADADAWEAALDTLLDQPAVARTMGDASRIDALARYGFDAWTPRAVQVFTSIAQGFICRSQRTAGATESRSRCRPTAPLPPTPRKTRALRGRSTARVR